MSTASEQVTGQQFATFFLGERMYGVEVSNVQEIVKSMPMTRIPLSPSFVRGLINLRGQIATAIDLRELFGLSGALEGAVQMNVVCLLEGSLVSLLVDQIGDVVEVDGKLFEPTPDTVSEKVRKFLSGVYKMKGPLLSVLNVNEVVKVIGEATRLPAEKEI